MAGAGRSSRAASSRAVAAEAERGWPVRYHDHTMNTQRSVSTLILLYALPPNESKFSSGEAFSLSLQVWSK
jgi:hypothetical protein